MKICSFLPSATEILFALGLGDSVAGVTFECNYPPQARSKPVVVRAKLPHGLTAAEIDREVATFVSRGESLYRIDADKLREIQPALIVTQDLCYVCAASPDDLAAVLQTLSPRPRVLSLSPNTLQDVWNDILAVGDATGRSREAAALVASLETRVAKVAEEGKQRPPVRVLCLEWLDPPYAAGHWVPEMVAIAGGQDVLGIAGRPGFRVTWEQVLNTAAELVIVAPCGYDEEQARAELNSFHFPPGWEDLPAVRNGRVIPMDANSYFSCPGPRLAEGVELLADLLSSCLAGTAT
jgi:iron complex transport system substrate-binding protein